MEHSSLKRIEITDDKGILQYPSGNRKQDPIRISAMDAFMTLKGKGIIDISDSVIEKEFPDLIILSLAVDSQKIWLHYWIGYENYIKPKINIEKVESLFEKYA
ncbi:MAG: hypothetical protein HRT90_00885 [Candidatus Margulisbacteria bacterium]|nr:hypothetical protein [Candidatus Margulisiibacteriota bacterium]